MPLRSDQLPDLESFSAFALIFGDGHDGAFVLDGTTNFATIASRSGTTYTLSKDVYATNLTINNGVTVRTNGYRIFCNGTWTNNGTISNAGNAASGATVGAALGGGTLGVSLAGGAATANGTGSAGGAASPTAGGSGGAGGSNQNAGGAGGTASVPAAGAGGLDQFVILTAALTLQYRTNAATVASLLGGAGGGGGGANNTTSQGGAGGGGGGPILIAARYIAGTGTITVQGGAGGNAPTGNAAGGGGGGGGFIIFISQSVTSAYWNQVATLTVAGQTLNMAGGLAGANIGTGTTTNAAAGGNGRCLLIGLAA